jgi:hypothetical protein
LCARICVSALSILLAACSHSEGQGASGGIQAADATAGESSPVQIEGRFGKPGGVRGEIAFKIKREGGKQTETFSVSVLGAPPGVVHAVKLDGVEIGKITTDRDGEAELEFVNSFPASFQRPVAGTTARVGELFEIVLQPLVRTVHLESSLSGKVSGKSSYKVESLGGSSSKEFKLKVAGAPVGSVHEVRLDGVVIGELTIDDEGEGKLTFSDFEGPDFPAGFPEPKPNSVLKVGSLVTAELADRQGPGS